MFKKAFLVVVVCALAASSLFFAYRWRNAESRLEQNLVFTHSVMDSLATTVTFPRPPFQIAHGDSLYWRWVATMAEVRWRAAGEALREKNRNRLVLLEGYEIELLKQEGLTDPVKQLRESLDSHPELIPYEAVLGGTMSFHEDSMILLDRPYVFSTFEDGHIQGYMLLSFEVSAGKIEWKRLWAELI